MKHAYINLDWNVAETEDITLLPSSIEKIGNTYFEKRIAEVGGKVEGETMKVESDTIDSVLLERAREYCRENKVRWYWLFKWKKLLETAIVNGFIL